MMPPRAARLDLPVDEIVRMYESGMSGPQIARRFGCSCTPIYARISESGIERREPAPKSNIGKPSATRIVLPMHEIAGLYLNGQTAESIAKQFGVSRLTIVRRLRAGGVEIRRRGWHNIGKRSRNKGGYHVKTLDIEYIVSAYKRGESMASIAEDLGTTENTIGNRLRGAGVRIRPPFGSSSSIAYAEQALLT
jgi:uncharacterized protein (DUF433 family)